MKLGRHHTGELLTEVPAAEHSFRCFSQLRSGGQNRRRLNCLELLGLSDGNLDFRSGATGTNSCGRLCRHLHATRVLRRLVVAQTQTPVARMARRSARSITRSRCSTASCHV
jgi:hypothetical protein